MRRDATRGESRGDCNGEGLAKRPDAGGMCPMWRFSGTDRMVAISGVHVKSQKNKKQKQSGLGRVGMEGFETTERGRNTSHVRNLHVRSCPVKRGGEAMFNWQVCVLCQAQVASELFDVEMLRQRLCSYPELNVRKLIGFLATIQIHRLLSIARLQIIRSLLPEFWFASLPRRNLPVPTA